VWHLNFNSGFPFAVLRAPEHPRRL